MSRRSESLKIKDQFIIDLILPHKNDHFLPMISIEIGTILMMNSAAIPATNHIEMNIK